MSRKRLGDVLPRSEERATTSAGRVSRSVVAGGSSAAPDAATGPHTTAAAAPTGPDGAIPSGPAGSSGEVDAASAEPDPEAEAVEFVRFCYRRRSVEWPELYDEMCAVAARGDYRGMTYEQLEGLGIGFALAALPRLAEMVARVIAEERGAGPLPAMA